MAKQISLLRHAEAADRSPATNDVDRPLTARGRADAALMGAVLARCEPRPDLALCSPAARTRETLDGVCARLPEPPHKIFNDELYDAGPLQLLAAIQALPEDCRHVLLVGHNPGVHEFALALAGRSENGAIKRIRNKFPKGALAQFAFDIADWREAAFAGGRLIGFAKPKDLRPR